jgi:hypothetical protein
LPRNIGKTRSLMESIGASRLSTVRDPPGMKQ